MPEEKRRSTAAKKKSPSKSKKSTKAYRKSHFTGVSGEIFSGFIMLIAVFITLSLTTGVTGAAGREIKYLLMGLFSWASYSIPVWTLVIAIDIAAGCAKNAAKLKLGASVLFTVFFGAFAEVLGGAKSMAQFDFSRLFEDGTNNVGGGAVGGLIGIPAQALLGNVGALLVAGFLMAACFMVVTGLTIYSLRQYLASMGDTVKSGVDAIDEHIQVRREKMEEKKQEREAKRQAGAAEKAVAPKKFNINLPVDEPAAKESPKEEKKEPEFDISGILHKEPEEAKDIEPNALTKEAAANIEAAAASAGAAVAQAPAALADTAPAKAEENIKFENSEGTQQKIYEYPPVSLLKKDLHAASVDVSIEMKSNAQKLVDTLKSFGVDTKVINVSRGPAVTRYELQPSPGVKISRITALSDDLALNLAASSVRIEAPIPGKAAVGIEVPNASVNTVYLREIIESGEFTQAKSKLTVSLGRDIAGTAIVTDIFRMPHLLVAGATGSGKSVCINSIVMSVIYKATPDEVKLLLIDPKMVELGVYNGIPHLIIPVVTDPKKASGALNWAVNEMVNRYKLFNEKGVKDLKGYNNEAAEGGYDPMPQIVIIIDELADLMMVAASEVEDYICRLAQMARAAGMHLVIATQRPSVNVVTGLIKANIPSRIAFAMTSQIDSRTILDTAGAEKLLGRGDMLFYPVGASKPVRIQGCFVSEQEIENVVEFVKKSGVEYNNDVIEHIEQAAAKSSEKGEESGGADDADELLPDAIECVIEAGMASASLLQRRLKLGYARAARIIDEMEERGIVGPYEGSKPRQVLITRQQWQEMVTRE